MDSSSISSIKTLLTAVIAVAGAAVMALVLAEQTTPQTLHTVVRTDGVAMQSPRVQPDQQLRLLAQLSCPTEADGRGDC
jgi:hypothetical protein